MKKRREISHYYIDFRATRATTPPLRRMLLIYYFMLLYMHCCCIVLLGRNAAAGYIIFIRLFYINTSRQPLFLCRLRAVFYFSGRVGYRLFATSSMPASCYRLASSFHS